MSRGAAEQQYLTLCKREPAGQFGLVLPDTDSRLSNKETLARGIYTVYIYIYGSQCLDIVRYWLELPTVGNFLTDVAG